MMSKSSHIQAPDLGDHVVLEAEVREVNQRVEVFDPSDVVMRQVCATMKDTRRQSP